MAGPAKSSPFYDVDGLTSDGTRTANFWISGPESEANMAGLEYYNGPGLSFDMDYRRFLHRLGVKPIGGPVVPGGTAPLRTCRRKAASTIRHGRHSPARATSMFGSNYPPGNSGVVGSDLVNAGDDYAIRVQQFDAEVKGNINENLSWQIGFWGMKKEGTRQANTQQHCSQRSTPAPASGSHLPCDDPGTEYRLGDRAGRAGNCMYRPTGSRSNTRAPCGRSNRMIRLVFGNYNAASLVVRISGRCRLQQLGLRELHRDRPDQVVEPDRPGHRHVCARLGRQHAQRVARIGPQVLRRRWPCHQSELRRPDLHGYGKSHVQNNSADTQSLNSRYPGQSVFLEPRPPQHDVHARTTTTSGWSTATGSRLA